MPEIKIGRITCYNQKVKKFYLIASTLMLEVFFVSRFFRPITAINEDLGRHLLFGKIIFTQHFIPTVNLLSYTNPTFPFINASWLFELVYFLLSKIGGFNLLLFVSTIAIAAAFWGQIYYAFKRYSVLAILLTTPLYILLLSYRTDVRPEIFSALFMSIFLVVLYSTREKPSKKLFLLVLLEILWANMHIYFFVGPVFVGLFLVDDLIVNKFGFRQSSKLYLLTLLGVTAVTVLNPNGVNGAIFPITVLFNYGLPIWENQSIINLFTIYSQLVILLPVFTAVILYFLLVLGKRNTKPVDWLLVTIFSVAMVLIFRNVLLFTFATFTIFIKQLDFVLNKYFPKIKKTFFVPKSVFYLFSLSFLLIILIQGTVVALSKPLLADYFKETGDFLIENKIDGPIYNNFNIGGYLSYRIYPQLVYIDNRPEAFPKSFFKDIYVPMQNDPAIFDEEDQKYHFNVLVIRHWDGLATEDKLLSYFVNRSNFKIVYLDPYSVILLRQTTRNEAIISKHFITKEMINVVFTSDSQVLVRYLFFFKKIGWIDKEQEAFARLKQLDPKLQILGLYPLPSRQNQVLMEKIF